MTKQRTAAQIERDAIFRDLMENVTDLIQSVDHEGRYLYVNKAWLAALGYDEAETPALTIQDIIDHTIGKTLDIFGIKHDLFERWSGPPAKETSFRQ